ncbi:hypothetical protein B0T18DRAFT_221124 [Schizothecium vesticola]|uniref:Uncharacterized protein n=1 Tax=Schizothecium vesticola TaxID=314040 RepID=A0AA40EKE2_9PEZI|nr:hypothetical protein B0T18DRAFT_221124 [Schizothecium vesticola]
MSDEKKDAHPPPPPYTPYSGSGDATGTLQQSQESSGSGRQQQEECTTSKGSSSSLWRRILRRAQVSSQEPLRQQASNSSRHLPVVNAVAFPIANIPSISQAWKWHNGYRACGHGAMLAKLPLPSIPLTDVSPCSLDITCYPPQPTLAPQVVGARWQQIESVQLQFRSDRLAEILRAPPIPWRANLDNFCHSDKVSFAYYPYPIPFSTNQPESGKAQAYCHDDNHPATPCGISASFGGHTYGRTIVLARIRGGGDCCYWEVLLTITSRDGEWLASLSRADAAALVNLNSVASVVGWIYPERGSIKTGVMFYAKTFHQPGLEPSDLESHRCGQSSPLGAAYDEEMRQLVDDSIEMLIRGVD